MSLTIIALTGILLGFLCLVIGFFMEGTEGGFSEVAMKDRKSKTKRTLSKEKGVRSAGKKKAA
jgi:hypothetical protein